MVDVLGIHTQEPKLEKNNVIHRFLRLEFTLFDEITGKLEKSK